MNFAGNEANFLFWPSRAEGQDGEEARDEGGSASNGLSVSALTRDRIAAVDCLIEQDGKAASPSIEFACGSAPFLRDAGGLCSSGTVSDDCACKCEHHCSEHDTAARRYLRVQELCVSEGTCNVPALERHN